MYSEFTDEALMARLKSDDAQALELLFNRYYKSLCQCCTLYTRDYTAAEEIVADLFIKLWDSRGEHTILKVRSYLFVAARNLSLNYIQKKKNPVDSIEDLTVQPHFFQDTNTPFKILSARESNNMKPMGQLNNETGYDSLSVTLYKGDQLPAGRHFPEPRETDHLFVVHFDLAVKKVKVIATDRFGEKYIAEADVKQM